MASHDSRELAIEATGDSWAKRIKPRIRLTGQWLERAGFPPGKRVEVRLIRPGMLELECLRDLTALEDSTKR